MNIVNFYIVLSFYKYNDIMNMDLKILEKKMYFFIKLDFMFNRLYYSL